jgi:GR25 family glycosyltransferase involved in LPS biosynthesis
MNLPRSSARRTAMEAEFRRVGWQATFVPALDGVQMLDLDSLQRDGVLSPDHRSLSKPLCHAEVGCYLTHEYIWRAIRRAGQPYAIICEDDIIVRDPAIDLESLSRRLPPACDLFYLYYMNDAPGLTAPAFDVKLDPQVGRVGPYAMYAAWSCGGTQCYLITAQGAEKALASSRPIRHPIDGYLARMSFEGRMATFATHPMAVRDGRLQSTIG